ncbi:MAG: M24 family metallopeptidase [Ignavibacteriae bacterium]|nr:M24 family metallopeptidase [Ignavibacteria bacterium]MBI3363889.1 M24 family metallopeptidase [Ignavibacteriota bacterium]
MDKIKAIQSALRDQKIDGWLFYDFWKRNEFAQRILEYPKHILNTRRFFYLIPAQGEPKKLVHSIERWNLDHLPGEKTIFLSWQSLEQGLKKLLSGVKSVAMEYSPGNAIPYISKVDAGTVETVRKAGVNVVSSMDLAQYFESRWSDEAYFDNLDTAAILHSIVYKTFTFMGDKIKGRERVTEYDVQQFMQKQFEANDLITYEAPNCSVNANSGNPHYEPTKEVHSELREGDFVLIDLWAKKNKPGSTYNDITWVGYMGTSVPEKYTKIFNVVKNARDAAADFLKKSYAEKKTVRGCDVDDVARNVIVQAGYGEYFIHRTGHSITEDLHGSGANMDNLETRDERTIIPQTSFSIEPGIYFMGDFGIRSEINVYISKKNEVIVPGEPRQQEVMAILR